MRHETGPPSHVEAFHQKLATVEPWAGELPPGPELRRLRELCRISQERCVTAGGVSLQSIWRYETGRVTEPKALDSLKFRRVVTALYELAVERKERAASQKAWRQRLAEELDDIEASL